MLVIIYHDFHEHIPSTPYTKDLSEKVAYISGQSGIEQIDRYPGTQHQHMKIET